ncbi:MAG: protein kinase [Gemmatimonadota bacterium]|jgi:serine/threonine-protein kinase
MEHEERLTAALADRYAIESEIGSGGMATVYLAQDLKHDRKVAVKVLKPELAAVVGTERFLAEIRLTANLAHPHILPLFDSGEADGFLFYVMPYVEGESLRQRLDRDGQLPVEEAVRIAGHVADALDYAHKQGVIHRDIKPANILFQAGDPVVTDFGIALAISAAGEGRLTETGLSLGTPYYMSPEQAAGDQTPTAASDVYSLGCVLYEMLTGDPPHTGSSAQAILGKILLGEVTRPTKLRRTIPANVEGVLLKALERLPADRFSSGDEVSAALNDENFRHGYEAGAGVGPEAARWRGVALALGTATVIVTAFALWTLFRPTPSQDPIRVTLALDSEFPTVAGPGNLALAPDGSFLVYMAVNSSGNSEIFRYSFRDANAGPVPGTENGFNPAISPDGLDVVYLDRARPGGPFPLRVVALDGSGPRTLPDTAIWGLHWGVDDFIYYTSWGLNEIRRIPAAGGSPETLVDAPEDWFAGFPSLSPDGDVLTYLMAPMTGVQEPVVHAHRLSSGEDVAIELTRGADQPHLVGARYLMYSDRQGRLLVAPIDLDRLEITGSPVSVAQGLEKGLLVGDAQFAVSSGVLVYQAVGEGGSEVLPVWVDRAGNTEPVDPEWTFDPGPYYGGFALSPDGSKVAAGRSPDGTENLDLWIKQIRPQGAFSILTNKPGLEGRPRWTPDGRSVTFIDRPMSSPDFNVFTTRADGAVSEAQLLTDEERAVAEALLSADGEWLVMRQGTGAEDRDIVARHLASDSLVTAMADPDSWQSSASLSPRGRWLAYVSNETGQSEIYVRSFPDLAAFKKQISSSGGVMPVWGRTGQELFYMNLDREIVAVNVSEDGGLEDGSQTILFSIDPAIEMWGSSEYAVYDVDVDDQRFLMLSRMGEDGRSRIMVAFNWLDELEGQWGGGR